VYESGDVVTTQVPGQENGHGSVHVCQAIHADADLWCTDKAHPPGPPAGMRGGCDLDRAGA
jgi:hypothetical protein